ncbi:MAG TPA: Sapep family Mn(2+)-dependent dipeptidase [Candidatus Avidehalobacter gallistercoris]|uniref:Sapep family Mn(2+)-dependent dipeptidase n=1 Tax=Candidatus Avidehalobacter gallistercoris TaxID=2840694 RepID=A0A9D1KZN8_9FIRM|nr:Sapep family Mn(2+)-dependent dipeptidase [Candidatus Avidehalobacter gallistercoris]
MHNNLTADEQRLLAQTVALYPKAKAALLELLSIPSVEGEPENDAPFGRQVANALQKAAEIAADLGLQANLTPYYLTVDYGEGSTEDAIGVLSHLDVVPFGEGWHFSPTGEVFEDKIYGRGSLDDKGPTVAALFALAAIKQCDISPTRPIRLIIGGNEESGSRCILHYLEEQPAPAFGFSPDANFPVIFAEKGIALLSACMETVTGRLHEIEAGTVVNAVPGKARAVLSGIPAKTVRAALQALFATELAETKLILNELPDNTLQLTAIGKAAHGSQPEKGINAAVLLLKALLALPLCQEEADACRCILTLFGKDCGGNNAGISCRDEISGMLTLNLGTLHLTNGVFTLGLDLRYPVTADWTAIYDKLNARCRENGIALQVNEHKAPLYVPKEQDPAAALLSLYREYEPEAEALAVGGGTYCRAFDNFVAFGPLRKSTPDLMHQADEYITEADFHFLLEIYARAILRLQACKPPENHV